MSAGVGSRYRARSAVEHQLAERVRESPSGVGCAAIGTRVARRHALGFGLTDHERPGLIFDGLGVSSPIVIDSLSTQGWMRYPDSGGLSERSRAYREAVRLQAAEWFALDITVAEIASRLRFRPTRCVCAAPCLAVGRTSGVGVETAWRVGGSAG